jgi:hypothetical protein
VAQEVVLQAEGSVDAQRMERSVAGPARSGARTNSNRTTYREAFGLQAHVAGHAVDGWAHNERRILQEMRHGCIKI